MENQYLLGKNVLDLRLPMLRDSTMARADLPFAAMLITLTCSPRVNTFLIQELKVEAINSCNTLAAVYSDILTFLWFKVCTEDGSKFTTTLLRGTCALYRGPIIQVKRRVCKIWRSLAAFGRWSLKTGTLL